MTKLILKEWQKEAIKSFYKNGGYALEAGTGTGKSVLIVALAMLAQSEKNETVVIVTAPHLIDDLLQKFNEFYPEVLSSIYVVNKEDKRIYNNKINIISYNKFALYTKEIVKTMNNKTDYVMIYDESHLIKSSKTKSFKLALKLSRMYKVKNLCTTATMQANSNLDLFSPAFLASDNFRQQYRGWYDFMQSNVETQKLYLASRQVNIPVKIYDSAMDYYINPNITVLDEVLEVKPNYTNVTSPYSKAIEKKIKQLEGEIDLDIDFSSLTATETTRVLNTLTNPAGKLLQLANNFIYDEVTGEPKYFKFKEKLDLLKSIVNTEASAGKKGILFYYYKAELEQIKKYYSKNKRIYYHNKKRNIVNQINEFEAGDFDLFIMNTASTSTGIRFKKSDYIIHFTIIWSSLNIIQINGRLNYIGRKTGYKIFNFKSGVEKLQYIENRVLEKQNEALNWSKHQREE